MAVRAEGYRINGIVGRMNGQPVTIEREFVDWINQRQISDETARAVNAISGSSPTITLSGAVSGSGTLVNLASVTISTVVLFANISSKPTTLAGYGITDAASKVGGAYTAWTGDASEAHTLDAAYNQTQLQTALNALGAKINELEGLLAEVRGKLLTAGIGV